MIKPGKVGFSYTDDFREQFDSENEQIILEKNYPDTIFFGDSLTWYMPLKKDMLPFSYINHGIPGDCAFYMNHRFEADVIQLSPQKVVILCGVNDIINCFMQVVPYVDTAVSACIDTIFNNIKKMALLAKENNIMVYLGSVLPIETPMGKVLDNNKANTAINELNQCIHKLCVQENLIFINYHQHFVDDSTGFLRKDLGVDGVHLKKEGYKKLFSILLPILTKSEGQ